MTQEPAQVGVVEVIRCDETPWKYRTRPGTLEGPWGATAEEALANLARDGIVVLDYWDRRREGRGFWASVRCPEWEECEQCNP